MEYTSKEVGECARNSDRALLCEYSIQCSLGVWVRGNTRLLLRLMSCVK